MPKLSVKLRTMFFCDFKALDVGSGSGYLTVCMALMVGDRGTVVGIEHVRELVEISIHNVRKNHSGLLQSGRVRFVVGDGRKGKL